MTPHRDGTPTEHGFVSMLPWPDARRDAVWLDGRNFAKSHSEETNENAEMTLRFAALEAGDREPMGRVDVLLLSDSTALVNGRRWQN